jgi:hypothetical protein
MHILGITVKTSGAHALNEAGEGLRGIYPLRTFGESQASAQFPGRGADSPLSREELRLICFDLITSG